MSSVGSTSVSQAQLSYAVGIAVARKAQDQAKSQGAAVVSLLQAAADVQKQQLQSDSSGHLGKLINTVA